MPPVNLDRVGWNIAVLKMVFKNRLGVAGAAYTVPALDTRRLTLAGWLAWM